MKKYDVIIIGGGPAGLFAAIMCANKKQRIALIEKNKSCGRKLLMAGAGKCNITQAGDIHHFLTCYGANAKFLKHALLSFQNEDLLNFFRKRGLEFITTEKGKVFPKSLKSQDVLNVLLEECRRRSIEIHYESAVESLVKEEDLFHLQTAKGTFESPVVVVATGGLSYPHTGSTGDGLVWAKTLGHKIVPTKPALTPLKIKNYELSDMSGTSFEELSYTLWRGGKKIGAYQGDFLLTHTGVSGPGIINNSRYMQSGDVIKCNFVGAESIDEFRSQLTKKLNNGGKTLVKSMVRELNLTKRFADKLLELCGIDENLKCAELNKVTRQKLLTTLTEYEMEVKELGGYHVAMVTTGGVSLKDIKQKTMESKKISNLYFIGEVLDIDGDTGGYNIQAAMSMAYIASKAINETT
ncbi:MAG: NAD(P)/FAD-dependent oxidoreductase [Turicibacter sp.]|nr:NAD(P)/FAD-dependent oxidoreductase [Turicibacter sp.]